MDAIIHAPQFQQQLESFWRSMKALVDRADFRENIKVHVPPCHQSGIAEDFGVRAGDTQSGFCGRFIPAGLTVWRRTDCGGAGRI